MALRVRNPDTAPVIRGTARLNMRVFHLIFINIRPFCILIFYAYSAKLYEKKREGRGVQLKKDKMKKDCESQSFFLHVKQSENYMEGGLWE